MGTICILASWIGNTDLFAMAPDMPPAVRRQIEKATKRSPLPPVEGAGPVRTLLHHERFDKILLLSSYPPAINTAYSAWLGERATIRPVPLDNPIDYAEIFAKVDRAMRAFLEGFALKPYSLSILLSPGTPAMAAIWVLLGKSKYPATFFQTYGGKSIPTAIPFDLAVDFVPELLHGSDRLFQQLASKSPQEVEGFEQILGDSRAIRLAVGRAQKAALRDVPVLLLGESGTGKELFAKAIHSASRRKEGPFVAVNCAAIPRELIESELFGHVKGAFTGANRDKAGAFKQADKGVLFLDEIGELAPESQPKLLRVLQPPAGSDPCVCEYQRVGATATERSDVRVIAASNRNLIQSFADGRFREDLYYRLAVIPIKIPPLRERKNDVPGLARAMLNQVNSDFAAQEPGFKDKYISDSTILFMKRYDWPGNVRQLRNAVLRAAVMAEGEALNRCDLEAAVDDLPGIQQRFDALDRPLGEGFSLDDHLDSIHRHYLIRAMREAGGNKAKATALLGLNRYQTLDARMKRLGVRFDKSTGTTSMAR